MRTCTWFLLVLDIYCIYCEVYEVVASSHARRPSHPTTNLTNAMVHRHQSWGWGFRGCDPTDFGMGIVGSPRNIIISYNVQVYDMRTHFRGVTFHCFQK